ncbi:uncharacterized protein N7479_001355 [Penicillium vulpinum]|uniref:Uncharacterized protein n=1 Tax=Penicillium vulpinum TaxID=29845 RepID=A0A1V6RUH8_9EURO|nr:uncharacterized protein N7479_001355 [Penicillium vulpinum]KAJ5971437.1 hypothetical protein N7479_001355 [Penicillium vulpinum]OQE05276.1 hypothetical protein PENVUL_c026G06161 [Penicillium vulpinum]
MLGVVETGYSRVSSSDGGLDELKHGDGLQKPKPWKRNGLVLTILVSALTGLIFGSISSTLTTAAVNHIHLSVNTTETASPIHVSDVNFMNDCGDSPAKARAQGCAFDTIMQLWVPPACQDTHLTDRFVAEGNWTWYADQRAHNPIPYEVLEQGEHQVAFAADHYHRAHCFYTWEALVRALRNRSPIMEEMMSYDHVMHCKMMGLQPTPVNSTIGVEIHPGYTRCAPYETWIRNLPEDEHSSRD